MKSIMYGKWGIRVERLSQRELFKREIIAVFLIVTILIAGVVADRLLPKSGNLTTGADGLNADYEMSDNQILDNSSGMEAINVDGMNDILEENQNVVPGDDLAPDLTPDLTSNLTIDVLLMTTGYENYYHPAVEVTSDSEYLIRIQDQETVIEAGTVYEVRQGDYAVGTTIELLPTDAGLWMTSLQRAQGTPLYGGSLLLTFYENGIAIVNHLSLEEYLYSVVPSEMPSTYPLEALKAQAVCARTYACHYIAGDENPALLGADVDDSNGYQVYNNIERTANTDAAVNETAGLILYQNTVQTAATDVTQPLIPVNTYYYSTSYGVSAQEDVWGGTEEECQECYSAQVLDDVLKESTRTEQTAIIDLSKEDDFEDFLLTHTEGLEREQPYYRWNYEVTELSSEILLQRLQTIYNADPERVRTITMKNENGDLETLSEYPSLLGSVTNIQVHKRLPSGCVDELLLEGTGCSYLVVNQNNIRALLCDGSTEATLSDGSTAQVPRILPSPYFIVTETVKNGMVTGYGLYGGGHGHGVGMSQNAAATLAENGWGFQEILTFFYHDTVIA